MKRFRLCSLLCSHLIHVLTFFPLSGGCSEGLDAFRVYVHEDLVSRDEFSDPVPRQPAHSPYPGRIHSRDSSRVPRRRCPFIYLNRHTPLGQSRVYQVTQLRADGVHCRESAGTGPVNLNVVPVTDAAILQATMDQLNGNGIKILGKSGISKETS